MGPQSPYGVGGGGYGTPKSLWGGNGTPDPFISGGEGSLGPQIVKGELWDPKVLMGC